MTIAFFKVPRTASSSISDALPDTIAQIKHNDLANKFCLQDYQSSFALVRHPFDRYISAYNWIKKGGKKKSKTDQNEKKNLLKYKTMDDLGNNIFEFIKKCKNPIHFYPQVTWLYRSAPYTKDNLLVKHVLIYQETGLDEPLNEFLKQFDLALTKSLPFSNKTEKMHLSDEAKERLSDYYKDDFEVFGFEPY